MLPSSIAICLFWIIYLFRSTIFAEYGAVTGLFYPLYLAIIAIAVRNFLFKKDAKVRLWLSLYYVFMLSIVVAMFRNPYLQFDFQTLQLVFIYSLGLLTFFQFTNHQAWQAFRLTTVFAAVTATVWVIYTSLTTTTLAAYRGGIGVDANYVSMIIIIGTLAIVGKLTEQIPFWYRSLVAVWVLLSFYAMTILGSRGMSIALLVGTMVIFMNNLRRFRTLLGLFLLGAVVFLILPELPGSDMLFRRFSGANIQTLNERSILWRGCWLALERGSWLDLLFGFGFRVSEDIIAAVTGRILTSTHNGYLRILLDQGVVGLTVFLSMLGLMLQRLWSERENGVDVLALFAALLVANLSVSATDGFIFWIVFGAAGAYAFTLKSDERGIACNKSG